jgi:hypothetical protein
MEETMKKQILTAVITLIVIAALSIAGFAGLDRSVEANIPFDFIVGGVKLPAGKYTVERGVAQSATVVRNWKTKRAASSITQDFQVRADSKPQMVFHRYGDQYFLAKVITYSTGIELPKSKAEREAAKAKRDLLTMKDAEPELVTVNAQIGQ